MQIPVFNTYFVQSAFLCADTKHSCLDYFSMKNKYIAQMLFHRHL